MPSNALLPNVVRFVHGGFDLSGVDRHGVHGHRAPPLAHFGRVGYGHGVAGRAAERERND